MLPRDDSIFGDPEKKNLGKLSSPGNGSCVNYCPSFDNRKAQDLYQILARVDPKVGIISIATLKFF